jgi:8-oxo-dGTP pyrophosphatase MutT (NUDIX family)
VTDRFRVVPAAYVVFRREHDGRPQVLLQLRRGTGYMDGFWATAAAGHVEEDESVLEAGCREAREELGVTVHPDDLVPLCGMHRTAGNHDPIDERVDFFFELRSWRGDPRLVEEDKAAELRWFRLGALPAPVVAHELFVLDRLRDGGLDPVVTFGF